MIEHPAEKHKYTTTLSGLNVYRPSSFRKCEVRLEDIIPGLAKICRFNGQINRFYSVAEHSILVSQFAEQVGDFEAILPGLFHDAHEAYSGDFPTPHKDMVPGLRAFEQGYETVVRDALGLPAQDDPVWLRVRKYDTMILHRELKVLRKVLPNWYDPKIEEQVPWQVRPVGLDWQMAERVFRDRIDECRRYRGL